ncbi:MAG: CAF17-like 4Fe-4S cluster assembly/insertion protein YgfZ [Planctomycetota bacterium]|jgi:folate-binding protein YgfZ
MSSMTPRSSPLRERLEACAAGRGPAAPPAGTDRPGAATGGRTAAPEVEYVAWGPDDDPAAVCEVVATLGEVEAEYAALRRAAGIVDAPQRGTIVVEGGERRDFLNRLLTNRLDDLVPGSARASFWLSRAGRIEADLLLVETGDRILVDVDRRLAAATVASLDHFLFADDVSLADASERWHRLAVHGPAAGPLVAAAAGGAGVPEPGGAASVAIGGVDVVAVRRDMVGAPGLELFVPVDGAGAVLDALLAAEAGEDRRVRPVGWYALNTARIEAGTPLFLVDFGPASLPHETGVLASRVSFEKGCYLGQEIVARMENLGRPKQVLRGLRPRSDRLPVAGEPVYERGPDGPGDPAGVVTSSALSPMLGAAPVAFAMVRAAVADAGTTVLVGAEGELVEAEVGDLAVWP